MPRALVKATIEAIKATYENACSWLKFRKLTHFDVTSQLTLKKLVALFNHKFIILPKLGSDTSQ